MDEVFEIRNHIYEAYCIEEQNKFISSKKPKYVFLDEDIKQKLEDDIRPIHDAYQLKTCY